MLKHIHTTSPQSTGAMSAYPYSQSLADKFTFETRFGEKVNMGLKIGGTLYVPRECVPVGKEDYRVKNDPNFLQCASFTYRPGQFEVVKTSARYFFGGQK